MLTQISALFSNKISNKSVKVAFTLSELSAECAERQKSPELRAFSVELTLTDFPTVLPLLRPSAQLKFPVKGQKALVYDTKGIELIAI
ncbi:MAG: hypothetical protein CL579_18335 [Alteromonadaceae bacterium]|jgi:hypothetical protein|nr:hypothetical protein [Alteromonadaceae bacterium]